MKTSSQVWSLHAKKGTRHLLNHLQLSRISEGRQIFNQPRHESSV